MARKTERRALIRIAAGLKPVVTVGAAGLTEGVLQEAGRALDDHELVKFRLNLEDRVQRRDAALELAARLQAELIQRVGKTLVLYRPNPEADENLSNIRRF